MATNPQVELEELKQEFARLRADMSELTETLKRLARSTAEEGRERLRSTAEQSREHARQRWDSIEREIEQRPMTSVAIALGIGFILGKLLDR
jgi:ElaB/YqjD/DUF883 family membrane-anchored ribosome-binding protein